MPALMMQRLVELCEFKVKLVLLQSKSTIARAGYTEKPCLKKKKKKKKNNNNKKNNKYKIFSLP
jgi:hypothetical protein